MNSAHIVVSTALCFVLALPAVGGAMDIRQFDKLDGDDQIEFVDQLAESWRPG